MNIFLFVELEIVVSLPLKASNKFLAKYPNEKAIMRGKIFSKK